MAFIGNTNTTQAFTPAIDYFSGNGSTTAFTLSRPVASVAQVQAVVNNVAQNPSDAFTVSGNTITFTSAPSSGTNNIYVYYTSPITQVIAPGQGTVGTTQLQNGLTVNFADGTAAAPSITNDGDTNTGIFFPAADTVGVSTGGSERMRIDSSGNVGIGASPASTNKLQVSSAGTTRLYVENTANNVGVRLQTLSNAGLLQTDTNHPLTFATNNGAEAMRIDSSGNVGIGTSSPSSSYIAKFLQVDNATSSGVVLNATRKFSIYSSSSSTLSFLDETAGAERMRIDSSGNLLFNSGYGSVATAYGCRAWVNFNGTGTVAIRASGNVSSITDNGTGNYTINFTTAMTDANYCVAGTASRAPLVAPRIVAGSTTVPATGSVRIQSGDDGGTANDCEFVNIAIFR